MRHKNPKSIARGKRLRKTMTKAETVLWMQLRRLRPRGYWFRRQHPIGPYNADFALVEADLVIEVDGATHSAPDEIAHDEKRDAYMRNLGWTIFRIPNESIYKNVAWTVEEILRRLPPPSCP